MAHTCCVSCVPIPRGDADPDAFTRDVVTRLRDVKRGLSPESSLWVFVQDATRYVFSFRDETQGARFSVKREAGISATRRDGSVASRENDVESAAAERFGVESIGRKFNERITLTGDDGDAWLHARSIEIKWIGMVSPGAPRESGHLIVNPTDPPRDVYVCVSGSSRTGFNVLGWCPRVELTRHTRDFGYGPKYAMHTSELRPIDSLYAMQSRPKPGELLGMPHRVALGIQADGWYLLAQNYWKPAAHAIENVLTFGVTSAPAIVETLPQSMRIAATTRADAFQWCARFAGVKSAVEVSMANPSDATSR